mgnify:FL=1
MMGKKTDKKSTMVEQGDSVDVCSSGSAEVSRSEASCPDGRLTEAFEVWGATKPASDPARLTRLARLVEDAEELQRSMWREVRLLHSLASELAKLGSPDCDEAQEFPLSATWKRDETSVSVSLSCRNEKPFRVSLEGRGGHSTHTASSAVVCAALVHAFLKTEQ